MGQLKEVDNAEAEKMVTASLVNDKIKINALSDFDEIIVNNELINKQLFYTSQKLGFKLKDSKIVIQGFGNVGGNAAKLIETEFGGNIIAVSDSQGCIYNDEGINGLDILKHKEKNGSVIGFPGSREITNDELLELDCDILIPSALEGQITQHNAPKVKAKLIVEGANGPTNPEADKILHKNGIIVVPDVLANAGGVTVSYFEWIQNLMRYAWNVEEVNGKLNEKNDGF